jgi:hypothetical protein
MPPLEEEVESDSRDMLPLDVVSLDPDAIKIEPPVDELLLPADNKISAPGPF